MKKGFLIFLFLITFAAAGCSGGGGGNSGGEEPEDSWSIYDWMYNDQSAASNESCFADCHSDAAYKLADNSSITERITGATAEDNAARDNYHGGPHFWNRNTASCGTSCHRRDEHGNKEMNDIFRFISDPLQRERIGGASCIGCHKSGNGHYGRKEIAVKLAGGGSVLNSNATAASWECFNCHVSSSAHNPPESGGYFAENHGKAFNSGLHANSAKTDYQNERGNILSSTYCGFCHSYNYSWKYNPLNGSKDVGEIKTLLGEHPFERMANTSLSCATCHDPHGGGLSEKVREYKDGGKVIYSKEFILCSSCHTVKLEYEVSSGSRSAYYLDGSVYGAALGSSSETVKEKAGEHFFSDTPESGVYGLGLNGTFVKTHFASRTGETVVTGIENDTVTSAEEAAGLNIDLAAARACTGCHDPHKTSRFAPLADVTQGKLSNIEESFAASGHAAYKSPAWNNARFGDRNCMPCHNAPEAVKFIERVRYAWDYATGPFKSIQPVSVNNSGGAALGCATCHNPSDTVTASVSGLSINAIKGVKNGLRATNGNHTNGKFYLPAARGVFNESTSISLPDKVLEKQKADGSLLCFTCHAGRTDIFIKKNDFTAQSYGASAHYAPSAGNAAGLLLPKIKDASFLSGLEARVNFDDSTTWSAHAGISGGEFPKCAACHDINVNGHSLAAYKDSGGKPLITERLADIDGISSVYSCGGCHGADGSEADPVSQAITSAKASAELLEFYGNALKIPEVNLRFSQESFEFWNGSGWLGDDASPTAWSADEKGLKKFAAALTYDALLHDKGAYAHLGREGLRTVFGEALAFIYQSKTNNSGNAAGFKSWLQNGGDSFIDSSGVLQGVESGGLEFLCPAGAGVCAYDDWKSVSW
jgi:hypothetical protein